MKIARLLVFCFMLFVITASGSFVSAADDNEEVTLTTYYPAPYGDYTNLTVSGELDLDGGLLNFTPISEPSSPAKGAMYYDEGVDVFRYYDGAEWKDIGASQGSRIVFMNTITPILYRATLDTLQVIQVAAAGSTATGAILNFEKINPGGGTDWGDVIIDLHRADNSEKLGRILAQAAAGGVNPPHIRNMGAFAIVPLVNGQVMAQRIKSEDNMNVDCDINVYVVALIE